MAKSILEKESSIVIFTFFVDVAKEIHKKLRDNGWNGEVLAGDGEFHMLSRSLGFELL